MQNQKRKSNVLKIFLLIFVLWTWVITISPVSAQSKIGQVCPKLLKESTFDGTAIICTKINGKLTWQIDTFKQLVATWKEVKSRAAATKSSELPVELMYSPTVNKTLASKLSNSVMEAAQFWQDPSFSQESSIIIFITEKDRSWFKSQLEAIGVREDCVTNKLKQFDDEVEWNGNKVNAAGFNGCGGVFWFEFYVGSKLINIDLKVAAHEYTHLAQFKLLSNSGLDYTPCWFHEGGADFYGMVLGAKTINDLKQLRKMQVWERYKLNFAGMAYEVKGGWERFLEVNGPRIENTKFDSDCGINGSYPVGAVATQYLFQLGGDKKIRTLMQEIGRTQNYRSAIMSIYGIPWTQLKKDIASYIRLVVAQTPQS